MAALALDANAVLLERAFPDDVKAAMFNCLFAAPAVLKRRENAGTFLRDTATRLSSARKLWAEALPANSPAAGVHFPLFHFLASNLEYSDRAIAKDLASGMPIVGRVEACGALTHRPMPDLATIEEWKRDQPLRNRRIVERVKNDSKPEIAK